MLVASSAGMGQYFRIVHYNLPFYYDICSDRIIVWQVFTLARIKNQCSGSSFVLVSSNLASCCGLVWIYGNGRKIDNIGET